MFRLFCLLLSLLLLPSICAARDLNPELTRPHLNDFIWPNNKRFALSLTFDDGRTSQVDNGLEIFKRTGAKATFYLMPTMIPERLSQWQTMVKMGQEIGNHSIHHPCTGNFNWVLERGNALELYSLKDIRDELNQASKDIERQLKVQVRSFAYPCGHTYIGRGSQVTSYIGVVNELFASGRTWNDETSNNPRFLDYPLLTGIPMDAKSFEQLLPILEKAKKEGRWLILAGHDIGTDIDGYSTRIDTLEKLIAYGQDPANNAWFDTVGHITDHIKKTRPKPESQTPGALDELGRGQASR